MNQSFKVVFNKARGALMVVNEVTSCVQAKGTKTVIAAAVAALTVGGAVAADSQWVDVPDGVKPVSETQIWDKIDNQSNFVWAPGADVEKTARSFLSTKESKTFDKELWVAGANAAAQATGLHVSGKDATEDDMPTLTNTGKIYVTSTDGGLAWRNRAMMAGSGATAINDGLIVAKNAYGMTVESKEPGSTIINNKTIVVEETGVGMELGAATGSKGENYGTISVGTPAEGDGKFTHGVLIKDSSENVFTNYGTIEAAEGTTKAGKYATAIEIQKEDAKSVSGNVLNFEAGSKIVGEVHIGTGVTGTKLNANGFKGTLDLNNQSDDLELNILKGAEVTLERDNKGSKVAVANVTDGRLNTSIWGDETKFSTVKVEENGIFNVLELNSTWDDPATKDNEAQADDAKKDQLLIKSADYTLNGGKLYAAGENFVGNLKIGTNSEKGTLTITKGDYKYENVRLGNSTKTAGASTLTVEGGSLTVTGLLDLRYGQTTVDGGKLALEGEYLTGKNVGTLAVKSGTFATTGANLFDEVKSEAKAGETTYELSDLLKKGDFQSGVIEVTDKGLELSKADVIAASGMLKDAGIGSDLVFSDVTFTDEELVFDDALGLNGKGQVIKADKGADEKGVTTLNITDTTAAVGQLVVDNKTTSITVAKEGESGSIGVLQLTGTAEGGNVIAGGKDGKVATLDANTLKLGWDESSTGVVNVDEVKVQNLEVVGQFKATNVVVENNGGIDEHGSLTLDKLSGTGTFGVSQAATLDVHRIEIETNLEQGATLVIGDRLDVPSAEGVAILAEDDDKKLAQIAETVRVGGGTEDAPIVDAIGTTNPNGRNLLTAFAGDEYDATKNVGLYVDNTIAVDRDATDAKLFVGSIDENGKPNGSISLGSNAVVVIDVDAFSADKAVFDAEQLIVNADSKVLLKGADRIGSVKLVENGTTTEDNTGLRLQTVLAKNDTNAWLNYEVEQVQVEQGEGQTATTDVNLNVVFDKEATKDENLNVFAEKVLTTGSESIGVVNAIGTAYFDETTKKLSAVGEEALDEYMALPAVAGTYNAAYDAAEQVWNTVAAHNIDRTAGKTNGVWADVFYSANEAGDMYGNGYGYEADVYGGVLGYDYTAACGGKIGAALTIGTSDVDAKGDFVGDYGNDADFWGLSIYASKDITEKMIVSADITYLSLDNDIKGSVAGASVAESIDSSVISVGLRADWKAYESSAFEIVPHAGIRYAQIDVDDYREMDGESLDVLEMPVGVAFNGKFEAAGMKFVPTLDFTVVPQIGDTEVHPLNGDTLNVLNNTYNTTLGISAEYGDFTFGVAAKYGFGTDDRSNAGVKINATYAF